MLHVYLVPHPLHTAHSENWYLVQSTCASYQAFTDSLKTGRYSSLQKLRDFLFFSPFCASSLSLPPPAPIFSRIPLPGAPTTTTTTIMAGSTLALRSKMVSPAIQQLSSMSRRSISTSTSLRVKPLRPNSLSQPIARVSRRSYADAPSPSTPPKPKKRFRLLRWTWRLTWLSGIGLTGALAYSIYSLRHPEEQYHPDPEKKTLVILGMPRSRSPISHGAVVLTRLCLQEPDGALFPCSRSSTQRITTLSSSPLATTSSSPPYCHHARPV